MNESNFKGALLEFLIRKLLEKCGFFSVKPDNLYTFESGNLFFINGRGAAHDADVLMEPAVQMPFAYPARILYECKAYNNRVGLPAVRNALGLRYDINEFEVVTRESLRLRKNNKRASYAVEKRSRYQYQVGLASINGFTKPAVEFAANNKIPLIQLNWILQPQTIAAFKQIDQDYLDSLNSNVLNQIFDYLKGKERSTDTIPPEIISLFEPINLIISSFFRLRDTFFVGLIESGDFIILRVKNERAQYFFQELNQVSGLLAQIHYTREAPEIWELTVSTERSDQNPAKFWFFIPPPIMERWKQFDMASSEAINIKGEYFSRIFVFNEPSRRYLPFFIIDIDRRWLEEVKYATSAWSSME